MMFVRTKDEYSDVIMIFTKIIQRKLTSKIARIKLDYGVEFKNAKLDNFYVEHGIHHNFSTKWCS